jgi:hypothetical protein
MCRAGLVKNGGHVLLEKRRTAEGVWRWLGGRVVTIAGAVWEGRVTGIEGVARPDEGITTLSFTAGGRKRH